MCIDELPGCEYYLMLFYGGEFIHHYLFQKRKREEKEKPRKTITTALQKKTPDYFGLRFKRF